MTTFQFQTHVSDSGVITLPMSAQDLYGKDVMLNIGVDDGKRTSGLAAIRRFHKSRKSLSAVEIMDDEIKQLKHERRMRKMS